MVNERNKVDAIQELLTDNGINNLFAVESCDGKFCSLVALEYKSILRISSLCEAMRKSGRKLVTEIGPVGATFDLNFHFVFVEMGANSDVA